MSRVNKHKNITTDMTLGTCKPCYTSNIFGKRRSQSVSFNLFRNKMVIMEAIPPFSACVNEPSIKGKKSVFFIMYQGKWFNNFRNHNIYYIILIIYRELETMLVYTSLISIVFPKHKLIATLINVNQHQSM